MKESLILSPTMVLHSRPSFGHPTHRINTEPKSFLLRRATTQGSTLKNLKRQRNVDTALEITSPITHEDLNPQVRITRLTLTKLMSTRRLIHPASSMGIRGGRNITRRKRNIRPRRGTRPCEIIVSGLTACKHPRRQRNTFGMASLLCLTIFRNWKKIPNTFPFVLPSGRP